MRTLIPLAACAAIAACSPSEEAAPVQGAAAEASASAGAVIPPIGSGPVTRDQIYAAAAEGPEAFARAIFAQYVNGGPQGEPPAPGRDPIFSRTMNALIGDDFRAANGEVPTLNYDPFCQCQDQEGFTVDSMAVAQGDANTAGVSVVFTNMGEQKTAILDLVREGGNWKVDDIETGMTNSLKDTLMAEAEARGEALVSGVGNADSRAMSDVVITRSETGRRAGRKPKGVTLRRITTANGEKVTVRSIDANSPTFGEDFLYVFTKNVEAARRDNKRLFGSADGVIADD